MRKIVASLLLGVALFAACGPGSDGLPGSLDAPGSDPDQPVTDDQDPVTMSPVPGSDVHDVGGRPQRTRPRPGMADLRQVAWEKARQTPSGRSLRITYWSGVEPCNVLDHVDVRYAPSKITVTLFEGHDPDAEDVACIEIALRKVVRVPLEEPVNGRRIVDGAPR